MAIQMRRGNEADLDISRLLPGELAICLDTGKVIIKLSDGNYLTLTDSVALSALISGKADASHSHETATTAADGMMSAADKTKLDGIAAGAQVNVKPDWNAAPGAAAEILNKPTYSNATTTADGMMSAADKTKLDSIEAAAAAPGKVASASAQGTSTNYAREDHTHGIDIATGDSNGQIKIAEKNVPVKGLGTMAYKNCLVCTQAQYNAATKDSQTIYLITG